MSADLGGTGLGAGEPRAVAVRRRPTGSSMPRRLALSTAAAIAQSLAIQVIAVTTLAPDDYGLFGLVYLAFAWIGSLTLSIVSEPWARSASGARAPWGAYAGALLMLVVASAALLLVALVIVRPSWPVWVLALAALIAALRAGARYFSAAEHDLRWVTAPDAGGALATVLAWAAAAAVLPPLEAVAMGWLVGSVAGLLLSRPVPRGSLRLRGWLRAHRRDVRVLLAESLLLDLGSMGVPLVLAGPLGVAGYGVYRAAQSTTAPALMALNPVRPMLGRWDLARIVGARALLAVCGLGASIGAGVALAVWSIDALDLLDGSVLRSLPQHLGAVALLVAAALPAHYLYLSARVHLGARALLRTRFAALALAALLPLGGVMAGGLSGALWGFAASVAGTAFALALELSLERRRRAAGR